MQVIDGLVGLAAWSYTRKVLWQKRYRGDIFRKYLSNFLAHGVPVLLALLKTRVLPGNGIHMHMDSQIRSSFDG